MKRLHQLLRLLSLALLILLTRANAQADTVAPLKPDASLDAVLDSLHIRGQSLKDFSADVVLTTEDQRAGGSTSQIGSVMFQNRQANDSRIKVSFTEKKLENGAKLKQKMDYLLDSGWLTDRDYQKKLEVKRQVLRPGQSMNLLKLGEGPFPLPIGQPKDEVKKQFEAKKIEATKDDPASTIHITLIPDKKTPLAKRFTQIDVFVALDTHMPIRIDTTEKAGDLRTTELKNIKLNVGVKDDSFVLENIEKENWNRREEPFN